MLQIEEHQKLVWGLMIKMAETGYYTTHASHENFRAPYPVGGFVPDVIAVDIQGMIALGEARTAAELEDPQTVSRLQAFAGAVMADTLEQVHLFVMVPAKEMPRARELLASLGLDATPGVKLWGLLTGRDKYNSRIA